MLMKNTRKLIRNSFLAFGQTSFVFGGSAVCRGVNFEDIKNVAVPNTLANTVD